MGNKCMKLDMKHVLFTDESRATLDGSDSWEKVMGFYRGQELLTVLQQGGGSIMIWDGIIDITIVVLSVFLKVPS